MKASPIDEVEELSPDRLYIILDAEKWFWGKVQWKKKVLNRRKMPSASATKFVLLKDLRGGADGRVWMACTTSGLCCVLKFASYHNMHKVFDTVAQGLAQLKHEVRIHRLLGVDAQMITLGNRQAMMLPYYNQVEFTNISHGEGRDVIESIYTLARKERLYHADMKRAHIHKYFL